MIDDPREQKAAEHGLAARKHIGPSPYLMSDLVKLIVAEVEWTQEEVCPLQTRGFSGHRESGDNNS